MPTVNHLIKSVGGQIIQSLQIFYLYDDSDLCMKDSRSPGSLCT